MNYETRIKISRLIKNIGKMKSVKYPPSVIKGKRYYYLCKQDIIDLITATLLENESDKPIYGLIEPDK